MRFELKHVVDTREIYDYMIHLPFPYHYEVEFDTWEKSYLYDIDGEGRTLFSDLTTVGAYLDCKVAGFIQYGRTAFGFDENGEMCGNGIGSKCMSALKTDLFRKGIIPQLMPWHPRCSFSRS